MITLGTQFAFPSEGKVQRMNLHELFSTKFANVDEIMKWTPGFARKWEFARGDKHIVVLVTNVTSGLITSQIMVFDKQRDGQFQVLLVRRRFAGDVTDVKEDRDNIVITAKDPILIIPWTGVIVGSEQN